MAVLATAVKQITKVPYPYSITITSSWDRYQLTLRARVYEGDKELTAEEVTKLGAVKWYRNGGTAVVATGQTITRAEYTRATYEARLEG